MSEDKNDEQMDAGEQKRLRNNLIANALPGAMAGGQAFQVLPGMQRDALRDQFAGQALNSIAALLAIAITSDELPEGRPQTEAIAKTAYEIADAMLAQRNKSSSEGK